MSLLRKHRPTHSVTLPLPVGPDEIDASGAWRVHKHKEGIAWAHKVEFGSRVHLEVRVTADGHVYVESVSVAGVLDQEEPAGEPFGGRVAAEAPSGDTSSLVDGAVDGADTLSDRGDGDSGYHSDGDALQHGAERIPWDVYVGRSLALEASVRLELRAVA